MDWHSVIAPALEQLNGAKSVIFGIIAISATGVFWKLLPKEQRSLIKHFLRLPLD